MVRFSFLFLYFCFVFVSAFSKDSLSNNDRIELKYSTYSYLDKESDENIRNFEKKHPNIKITVDNQPYDEYCSRLLAVLEYGKPDADIYTLDFHIMDQLLQSQWFDDLNQPPFSASQYSDLFDTRQLRLASSKEGYLYALPLNTSPGCIIYLKPLFVQAVIDPEKIRSIEDLYQAGLKIAKDEDKDGKNDRWIIPHFQPVLDMVLCARPSQIYTMQDRHIILNKKGLKELMEWAKKFREAGLDAGAWERTTLWYRYITEGRIAYIPAGAELASELQHRTGTPLFGQFRIMALPSLHKGEKPLYSLKGGSYLAIPTQIPHNRKLAAWEFISYLTMREDSQLYYYKTIHSLPALKVLWNNPVVLDKNSYFGGQASGRIMTESIKRIDPDYRLPIKGPIANILYIILDNVLEERKTINKAIDDAQAELNQLDIRP